VLVEEPRERHKIRYPHNVTMTRSTAVIANGAYTRCLGCDALRTKCTVNVKVFLASTACFGVCFVGYAWRDTNGLFSGNTETT
jgi:hypothetical protein